MTTFCTPKRGWITIFMLCIFSIAAQAKLNFCYKDVYPQDTVAKAPQLKIWYGKKLGYYWSDGTPFVEPKWKSVREFSEGRGAVAKSENKWGFVDSTGVEVVVPQYYKCGDFHSGLAAVKTTKDSGGWGYIDLNGNMIIQPQFRTADDFAGELAAVSTENGLYGIINKKGEWFLKPQSHKTQVSMLNDSTYLIKTPAGIIMIHDKENLEVVTDCSEIKPFTEGVAAARSVKNNLWGYINELGSWLIEPQFAAAGKFWENIAFAARYKEHWSDCYKNRDLIVSLGMKSPTMLGELNQNEISMFEEGVAFIICTEQKRKARGEGVGIINKKGNKLQQGVKVEKKEWEDFYGNQMVTYSIPAIISQAYNFNGGIAYVKTPTDSGAIKHPFFNKWTLNDFIENTIGSREDFLVSRGCRHLTDTHKAELREETNREFEQWLQKGEFEKTEDWEKRTSPANREAKLNELREKELISVAEGDSLMEKENRRQDFLAERLNRCYDERLKTQCNKYAKWMHHRFLDQEIELLEYDADNERFGLSTEKMGLLSVNVPIADAQKFKQDWYNTTAPAEMPMQLNDNRGVRLKADIVPTQSGNYLLNTALYIKGYAVSGPDGEEFLYEPEIF